MPTSDAVLGTPVLATPSFPRTTTYFQQRQAFAGFSQAPEKVALSRSGDYPNFGYSTPAKDDDAIDFTVASTQLNAIKHLISLNSLIVLTDSGAFKVDAAQQGAAITPTSFQVTPQVYNGASDVTPLVINYDILYVQGRGSIVRDLSYNFYVNLYTGSDVTSLSNHLFFGHKLTEWTYAEEPFKIIWAVRDDGVLLSLTYLKEQDVMGWAHSDTLGRFKSVTSIIEDDENAVYLITQRFINGQYVQYYERFASRQMGGDPTIDLPADVERAFFVDSGLRFPLGKPDAQLIPTALTAATRITAMTLIAPGSGYTAPNIIVSDMTGVGAMIEAIVMGGRIVALNVVNGGMGYANPQIIIEDTTGDGAFARAQLAKLVVMNASASIFSSADVGSVVRVNNGRGPIYTVNSAAQIVVDVQKPLTNLWPAESGQWSCTKPVTVVRGLDHLNGQMIAGLADGNVIAQQIVSDGSITLDHPASAIVLGLPIPDAELLSLYLDVGEPTIQSKRQKVDAITVRMQDSRGVEVGHNFTQMHAFKERDTRTPMGVAIDLITGDERIKVDPEYKTPGQIAVRQRNPLPCTVLGLIPELSVGDS